MLGHCCESGFVDPTLENCIPLNVMRPWELCHHCVPYIEGDVHVVTTDVQGSCA